MTNDSLMKVESIAECSPWSILQYFWPALSDNWSWKTNIGLFESGRFTQVLLYSCLEDFRTWLCLQQNSFLNFIEFIKQVGKKR